MAADGRSNASCSTWKRGTPTCSGKPDRPDRLFDAHRTRSRAHVHKRAAALHLALNLMAADSSLYRDRVIHIHVARAGMRVQVEGRVRGQPHVHATGAGMG